MPVKSKKLTPTKKGSVGKVEKSKKNKGSPEVDHIDEDMSDLDEKEEENVSNEEMGSDAGNDSGDEELDDEDDVKPTASKVKPGKASKKLANNATKAKNDKKSSNAKHSAKDKKDSSSAEPVTPLRKSILGQRDNRSVYIKNLKTYLKDKEITELFASVGKVVKVRYIRSKGSVFVLFDKEESVEKAIALTETKLKGHRLRIERVKPVDKEAMAAKKLKKNIIKKILKKKMAKLKKANAKQAESKKDNISEGIKQTQEPKKKATELAEKRTQLTAKKSKSKEKK